MSKIPRIDKITLNFGIISVDLKFDEVQDTLFSILNEMGSITKELRDDERELLRKIMARASATFTANDLSLEFEGKGFDRGSKTHMTLRRLRDAQFIRPIGSGPFEADKRIEIKTFGKLMWEKVGEDKLFS